MTPYKIIVVESRHKIVIELIQFSKQSKYDYDRRSDNFEDR